MSLDPSFIVSLKHFRLIITLILTIVIISTHSNLSAQSDSSVWKIEVLGIAQDAGYPQAGCSKSCCVAYWKGERKKELATCLALLNTASKEAWLFEATPDIKDQWHQLVQNGYTIKGIFLTHAHIGHYAGLIHLGHEVMGTNQLPVYVMPRMNTFLEENAPWSQLIKFKNISLNTLINEKPVELTKGVTVTPIIVPHRDEFSETVGFHIQANRSLLFIPDINKWDIWNRNIREEVKKVDYALLDATFYDGNELPGRDMTKIPHPFISESIALFNTLSLREKKKVHFIHFNHTNPVLDDSKERKRIKALGFSIAKTGMTIDL